MKRAPIRFFLLGVALLVATAAMSRTSHGTVSMPAAGHPAAVEASGQVPMAGGWTFQGCWKPNTDSACLDIYTDSSGTYYICKPCGTTRNPSPGKCSPTTAAFLNSRGLWCS